MRSPVAVTFTSRTRRVVIRSCHAIRRNLKVTAPLAVLLISACSPVTETPFSSQIVIQGFLYANEPFDSVVLRQTIPISGTTTNDRISGAAVILSNVDTNYVLHEDTVHSGRYISNGTIIIRPGMAYTLQVHAFGQVVTATTTVPLAIHLDSVKFQGRMLSLTAVDTVPYPVLVDSLYSPGVHLWWSPSPGAAGYGLEALSLDSLADTILDPLSNAVGDSGAMGRYHFFIISTDEQVVWPQFTRYGLNVIRALALDKNYEDFILGLYLSGSQFNNNTLDVSGGLGVFGSVARASKEVYLQ